MGRISNYVLKEHFREIDSPADLRTTSLVVHILMSALLALFRSIAQDESQPALFTKNFMN